MQHTVDTYQSPRYPEERDIEDPFLDASGLDPAGEPPRPDLYSYHDEANAERSLIALIRRQLAQPRYHLVA